MLRDSKELRDLLDVWSIRFARAYAEFVRALSEGPMTPSLQQSRAPLSTGSHPATSFSVEEVSEADDAQAVKRAKEAHEAYLVAVRDGTARTVQFNSAVPAKN